LNHVFHSCSSNQQGPNDPLTTKFEPTSSMHYTTLEQFMTFTTWPEDSPFQEGGVGGATQGTPSSAPRET